MLKKSSRRVFGLVVAALIASVAAAQPVPAAAPTNGTLLGAVSCLFCSVVLDQLDPAAGTGVPLFTLGQFSVNAMVADPTSHLVYGVAGTGGGKGGPPPSLQIFTADTQTGKVTTSPALTLIPSALTFDPATHQLFGVTFTTVDGHTFTSELFRVDPATGAVTSLATFPSSASNLAVDPASNTLYSSAGDRLFAFNPQTGAILRVTNLNPNVSHLVYDTAAGALYGVSNASRFVQVNPNTGAETQIGTFNFPAGFATAETIDSGTHTAYFVETDLGLGGQFVNRIATINDQTGHHAREHPGGRQWCPRERRHRQRRRREFPSRQAERRRRCPVAWPVRHGSERLSIVHQRPERPDRRISPALNLNPAGSAAYFVSTWKRSSRS